MTLTGLDAWQPPQPVILVASPDDAPAIAANYPKACVVSLPADPTEQALLAHPEAWGAWLPLMGADVTLWPVSALQVPYFAACVPILRDAGVRTLRLAVVSADWALYERVDVLWRDAALHPGPPAGHLMMRQMLRSQIAGTALEPIPQPVVPQPPRPAEEVKQPAPGSHPAARDVAA